MKKQTKLRNESSYRKYTIKGRNELPLTDDNLYVVNCKLY